MGRLHDMAGHPSGPHVHYDGSTLSRFLGATRRSPGVTEFERKSKAGSPPQPREEEVDMLDKRAHVMSRRRCLSAAGVCAVGTWIVPRRILAQHEGANLVQEIRAAAATADI